ncbi:hypothetical protein Pcinc_042701 [Petrolisthes cinctipes]|uniref:Uncharacterized protein n=1 Tax=Petrolisthes cinctipes TaxID=88211 RepID=A0AAE1EFN4_PETCI|nr:hypothetical protein Pcinc_042701 [Petrolisthes cinctipes]
MVICQVTLRAPNLPSIPGHILQSRIGGKIDIVSDFNGAGRSALSCKFQSRNRKYQADTNSDRRTDGRTDEYGTWGGVEISGCSERRIQNDAEFVFSMQRGFGWGGRQQQQQRPALLSPREYFSLNRTRVA